ncbi:MAG TPA: DUF5985 family protein [Phenylobacterium sp.]|uniref:DUF5985 family protein n=1 Tax=Phenylobacterium sp. TaxID=1871053 RepID=UPI002BADFE84|nr:DUF5985 family protein [Phenylobacterium sp.]HSV01607.1 DUF5985 family protein [Phenylobacterium sp.]
MSQHAAFIAGALSFGYLVAGLFFLKFWRRTHDVLFLAFAAAFALMALNQAVPAIIGIPDEAASGVYLLRLAAFLLIIWAILRKNIARPH